jgi:hypothetical protein
MAYLELVDSPLVFKQRIPLEESASTSVTEEADVESAAAEAPSEEEPAEVEGEEPAAEGEPPAEEKA